MLGTCILIAGGGSKSTISQFKHSEHILNNTIKNGTARYISRQQMVRDKHLFKLVVSAARYVLANSPTGVLSQKGAW